jgi:hypothetical protein
MSTETPSIPVATFQSLIREFFIQINGDNHIDYQSLITLVVASMRTTKTRCIEYGSILLWLASFSHKSWIFFESKELWVELSRITAASKSMECCFYMSLLHTFITYSSMCNTGIAADILDFITEQYLNLPEQILSKVISTFSLFKKDDAYAPFHFITMKLLSNATLDDRKDYLPGLLINLITKSLMISVDRSLADEVLVKWVLPNCYRVISSSRAPRFVNEKLKSSLSEAMSLSEPIRMQILDMFINLCQSFDSPNPCSYIHEEDPRVLDGTTDSCSHQHSSRLSSDHSTSFYNRQDIEWKPRSGNPWKLWSSIIYCRCPGLRDNIDEFWESGEEILHLAIDVSNECLYTTCKYIYSSIYFPPSKFICKLELVKVSIELDMHELMKSAVEDVQRSLTDEYLDLTRSFGISHQLDDLVKYCELHADGCCLKTTNLQINMKAATNPLSFYDDTSLVETIQSTIHEIDLIEENDRRAYLLNESEFRAPSRIDTATSMSMSKGKMQSGGIYGLLLKSTDTGEDSRIEKPICRENEVSSRYAKQALSRHNSTKTDLARRKSSISNKSGNGNSKMPSTKKMASAVSFPNSTIEYDASMSLQPENTLPDKERR